MDTLQLISRTEAEVLHKYGVPVLCTAFVGKEERQYYALGVPKASPRADAKRTRRGGVVTSDPVRLTAVKHEWKRANTKTQKVYDAIRKILKHDLRQSMPANQLRAEAGKLTGLSAAEIAPIVAKLRVEYGLIEVVPSANDSQKAA